MEVRVGRVEGVGAGRASSCEPSASRMTARSRCRAASAASSRPAARSSAKWNCLMNGPSPVLIGPVVRRRHSTAPWPPASTGAQLVGRAAERLDARHAERRVDRVGRVGAVGGLAGATKPNSYGGTALRLGSSLRLGIHGLGGKSLLELGAQAEAGVGRVRRDDADRVVPGRGLGEEGLGVELVGGVGARPRPLRRVEDLEREAVLAAGRVDADAQPRLRRPDLQRPRRARGLDVAQARVGDVGRSRCDRRARSGRCGGRCSEGPRGRRRAPRRRRSSPSTRRRRCPGVVRRSTSPRASHRAPRRRGRRRGEIACRLQRPGWQLRPRRSVPDSRGLLGPAVEGVAGSS